MDRRGRLEGIGRREGGREREEREDWKEGGGRGGERGEGWGKVDTLTKLLFLIQLL